MAKDDDNAPMLNEIVDPAQMQEEEFELPSMSPKARDEVASALAEDPDLIKKVVDSLKMELTKQIGDAVISAIEDLVPKHIKRAIRNAPK